MKLNQIPKQPTSQKVSSPFLQFTPHTHRSFCNSSTATGPL